MTINEISSHKDLINNLKEEEKTYLLLYKKNSELSECAYDHITETAKEFKALNILSADVTKVKDIHNNYGINTVPSLLIFEGKTFKKVIKGCSTSDYYRSLFESNLFYSASQEGKPQKNVTVYSTPSCSWCNTLKNHLRKNRINYTDIDISTDPGLAEELVRRSGQQGVPQTEINGEFIIGFDKTKINKMLNIKN